MIRDVKIRPTCVGADYQVKLNHIIRFLGDGAQVKLTVMFKGREVTHPERGEVLLLEFVKDLEKYAKAELPTVFEARQMFLILTPKNIG